MLWLPGLPESVATARTRVRRFVRLPPGREDALALLVTELVSSFVSAYPPTGERVVEVRLERSDAAIRVAVRRSDHRPARLGELSDRLVERLADHHGEDPQTRWIELRTRERQPA